MRTIKSKFNQNIDQDRTFEYFSCGGYRVFSHKDSQNKKSYFHLKNNQEIKENIDDITKIERVVCPECKTDEYLKIQKSDGRNTKYACKNKSCQTTFFRNGALKQTITLDKLIKSHFKISSFKKHELIYKKYKQMKNNYQRINIEDDDLPYLEHYLLLGIPRTLIGKLFSISSRTLTRLIEHEKSLEAKGKSRFKKEEPLNTDKKLIMHNCEQDVDPFKSTIIYSYIDLDYDSYEEPNYYIDKKITKSSQ